MPGGGLGGPPFACRYTEVTSLNEQPITGSMHSYTNDTKNPRDGWCSASSAIGTTLVTMHSWQYLRPA